ncbi:hypothetical protein M413DRAFT_447143 [Hebeloma cylindrosporum]|uniref:Transmembrane protein n=1 Tax=Hebeloma cylindrosporum TaxID=76867 RepID=A0A0C3C7Z7_HEBCY|nr:hypothetical protein M413DRAFT_447143 [Hebeloma cylindrosporum h7]
MPGPSSRRVVIDDNDSRIIYSSAFFVDSTGIKDDQGNFGATLKSTLHGTNSTGSFQFRFSGTAIDVFGTTDQGNSSGVIDPTWECFIDNTSIGATNPYNFAENNWLLCSAENLADTSHVITVNVKSRGRTFWFDYFQYLPSPNISTEGEFVLVQNLDPDIHFDSSWQPLGPNANMTVTKGGSVTFKFMGVGLSFYGLIPRELPISPSLATFSIDGGPTTPVALKGLTPGSVTLYNQKFFETPTLPYGLHTLNVTYKGDDSSNGSTPLVLDYLLIQNGSIASSSTPLLPASTAAPVSTSATKNVNVAGVVCGVLAAIAFLLVLAFFFMKYRKSKEVKFAPSSKFLPPNPFRPRPPPIQESTSFSSLGLFTPSQSRIDLAGPPTHRRRISKPTQQPEASGSQPRRFPAAPIVPPKAVDDQTSYYGGYQTWGQAKALEAASKKATARPRDSYM